MANNDRFDISPVKDNKGFKNERGVDVESNNHEKDDNGGRKISLAQLTR
jgi:hypothetical protein